MQTLQRNRCQTRTRPRKKACIYGAGVSGATIYSYVEGNPLSFIDLKGLVKWTGTSFGGGADIRGFGGGSEVFTLTSECKNGIKFHVRVRAEYLGVSVGSPYNLVGGFAEFKDPNEVPDPDIFNGSASKFSLGTIASPAGGVGVYQATQLGGAGSAGWFQYQIGLDVGLVSWSPRGTSKLLWSRPEVCKCP